MSAEAGLPAAHTAKGQLQRKLLELPLLLPVTVSVLLLPAPAIAWLLSPRDGVASPVLFSAAR